MKAAHQIPVLQKAIRVLDALAGAPAAPTMSALARELRIAPATCYRILRTFAHAGWVRVGATGACELAPGLFPLLHRLQAHDLLGPAMDEALQALTALTGVTSKVSVREGDEAVTVLRVDSPQPIALTVRPGARFHLTLGASGAVLLAALPDTEVRRVIRAAPAAGWQWQQPADVWRRVRAARARGVVADLGTYRPDIFGVSAPLHDGEGRVQGSLTLTGLIHGHSKARLQEWCLLLARKAAELNQRTQRSKP